MLIHCHSVVKFSIAKFLLSMIQWRLLLTLWLFNCNIILHTNGNVCVANYVRWFRWPSYTNYIFHLSHLLTLTYVYFKHWWPRVISLLIHCPSIVTYQTIYQRFYFTVGDEGLVRLVHFTVEETYELLTLKKVLASTLATRVQVIASLLRLVYFICHDISVYSGGFFITHHN